MSGRTPLIRVLGTREWRVEIPTWVFMKLPLLNDFDQHFHDPVWLAAARYICREHAVPFSRVERAEHGENIVLLIDNAFVLKIYTPKRNGFARERAALEFAAGRTSLPIPKLLAADEIGGYEYVLTDRLPGRLLTRDDWLSLDRSAQIGLLTQLAYGLKELHSHDAGAIHFDWHEFISVQIESVLDRQRSAGGNPEWIEAIPRYLDDNISLLPKHLPEILMHGDVHFGNIRVTDDRDRPVISGLYDFADSLKGFREYEFVAPGVLMIQGQGEIQREFFRAYGYNDSQIDEDLRTRLMLLTILYECSSLKKYALRLKPEAIDFSLLELERAIWNFV